VVPLRAYYFSKDEKLLVYDYMSMGSLSALLHGNNPLSLPPFLPFPPDEFVTSLYPARPVSVGWVDWPFRRRAQYSLAIFRDRLK
jgi:hypothetical protein